MKPSSNPHFPQIRYYHIRVFYYLLLYLYLPIFDRSKQSTLKTVGETLRLLRESKNLLLREVAASIEIDPTLLSKIERGQRKATKEQVIKLAHFFKADEKELLVLFLSDRIVSEMQNETLAKEAIQLAEQQIEYITNKKKTKKK